MGAPSVCERQGLHVPLLSCAQYLTKLQIFQRGVLPKSVVTSQRGPAESPHNRHRAARHCVVTTLPSLGGALTGRTSPLYALLQLEALTTGGGPQSLGWHSGSPLRSSRNIKRYGTPTLAQRQLFDALIEAAKAYLSYQQSVFCVSALLSVALGSQCHEDPHKL